MKLKYKHNGKATVVRFGGLEGISICRRGDRFDPALGVCIALMKLRRRIPEDALTGIELPPGRYVEASLAEDEVAQILAAALAYRGEYELIDDRLQTRRHKEVLYIERFAQDLKRKLGTAIAT